MIADPPGGAPETVLPDELIDALARGFRRLRRTMIKPPDAMIPVSSLGRPVDIAKLYACDAIAELAEASGPVTVKDVAAALDLEHSTVSRLLGDAEADGLLVRGGDPDDRRRTTVSLTPLGRQLVADSEALRRAFARIVLAGWERPDVETLSCFVARLADSLGGR